MIGGNQLMTYHTYETGVNISSIENIYNFITDNYIESISFLNEEMKLIPCKVIKNNILSEIVKIKTDSNIHYLSNESVLSYGKFKNSNELKIDDYIAKYNNNFIFKKSIHYIKENSVDRIENTYHLGMFFGLIYGFGGISKHKITFSLNEKNLKGLCGNFITLEETVIKIMEKLEIESYRLAKDNIKGEIFYRYEIMLNLKTSKKINGLFTTFINEFQKKLNILKFIENQMFSKGFIDAFVFKTSLNQYKTSDSKISREILILCNLFGIETTSIKTNGIYNLTFKDNFPKDFFYGNVYEKIISIEKELNITYDIIPIIKDEKQNIFITSTKCFLDRREKS